MRIKAAVVVLVLTLVSSTHVTGQQEALPAVTARANVLAATAIATTPVTGVREEPTVYLPAVPIREQMGEPSLTEAAQNHDYATFHEQYMLARSRGERVAQFDALYELWSWSMSSPTGAFYGPELYARIAAAYPSFEAYIDDYTVVDRNGNVFYPTAETRTFLLEQAMRNRTAPRVLIARDEPGRQPTRQTVVEEELSSNTPAVKPAVREIQSAPLLTPSRSRSRARMQKAEATPAPATSAVAAVTPAPAPVAAKAEPMQVGAVTPVPAPIVAAPAIVQTAQAQTATPRQQQPQANLASMTSMPVKPINIQPSGRGGRAVLMIVVGLLGAGILAVLLRASKDEPLSVLPAGEAPAASVDVTKVEPIRKPEGAEPRSSQVHDQPSHEKKNRRAHAGRR